MLHELKTWPTYFQAVKDGRKRFEVRKDDRGFEVGDDLLLKEFVPADYYDPGDKEGYTGEILHRKVSYILKGGEYGIEKGHVVLGLHKV